MLKTRSARPDHAWDEEQEGMRRLPTATLVSTHGTVVAARTDGCRRVPMTGERVHVREGGTP